MSDNHYYTVTRILAIVGGMEQNIDEIDCEGQDGQLSNPPSLVTEVGYSGSDHGPKMVVRSDCVHRAGLYFPSTITHHIA